MVDGGMVVSDSMMLSSKEPSCNRRLEARGIVSGVNRELASNGTHIAFNYNTSFEHVTGGKKI